MAEEAKSPPKARQNKAEAVREYLLNHPRVKNTTVIEALSADKIEVDPGYVSRIRASMNKTKSGRSGRKPRTNGARKPSPPKYPRHSLHRVLRVPKAILDQNAGRECTEKALAGFVGVGLAGPFRVEISSAIKFGLLERPSTGKVKITDLARMILRPQSSEDELSGLRKAVLLAPEISKVYNHYRGENLPDTKFFNNALVETFGIPQDKLVEFTTIFLDTLSDAKLLEKHQDKYRIIDASDATTGGAAATERIKELGKTIKTDVGDRCFVMMPFAFPHGEYYSKIYDPAIRKAGLTPVRADADIFGSGKIMDQVWSGINSAKVLLAELTTRNPNVFYELGLAHALEKPVVLVSSNESDVPFDLHHIRVIYYDVLDPFWGQKLLDKVAENILSAIKRPEEAIFKRAIETEK